AWRSRYGIWGALPLAFMVQMLVANMSGNNLTFKLYFLFQAFAIASMSMPLAVKTPRIRRSV
ncbi:MAG TPA: hypothetical protein VKZ41_06465, partial [Gemmatimonadales bacterium]|nr:hypothetical protein [Gemmatimonadales bacterium]